MPGAWEIKAQTQVLVATLHVDNTTVAWAYGLRNLQVPGHVVGLTGMPFDHARNVACQHVLSGPYQYLFFLDSDVVPPHDAIPRLMAHRKPLISGMYCRRSPPWSVPVMIRNGQWVTRFRAGSVVDVDLVGAGCLLIHRSVLERLPWSDYQRGKRWFDWKVDCRDLVTPDGRPLHEPGTCLSEDFTFCASVRKHLGIPTLVDTSIQCKHIGYSEATYGSLKPLEVTPVT